jgi:ATP-dependent Clp protease adapter protein ClpS
MRVMAAVKCGTDKAMQITMEAHNNGEAVAFSGSFERCEFVDSILSAPPLKLKTDIQEA